MVFSSMLVSPFPQRIRILPSKWANYSRFSWSPHSRSKNDGVATVAIRGWLTPSLLTTKTTSCLNYTTKRFIIKYILLQSLQSNKTIQFHINNATLLWNKAISSLLTATQCTNNTSGPWLDATFSVEGQNKKPFPLSVFAIAGEREREKKERFNQLIIAPLRYLAVMWVKCTQVTEGAKCGVHQYPQSYLRKNLFLWLFLNVLKIIAIHEVNGMALTPYWKILRCKYCVSDKTMLTTASAWMCDKQNNISDNKTCDINGKYNNKYNSDRIFSRRYDVCKS